MVEDFSRSPAGLANYGLFLNADVVIFCEGERYIEEGEETFRGPDQLFWNVVVADRFVGRIYRFWPVGPKSQVLKSLSASISEESAENSPATMTFGCIDRDYDNLGSHSNVAGLEDRLLSTDGYCVENDLLALFGLEQLCQTFMPRLPAPRRQFVKEALHKFLRLLKWVVKIDRAFRLAGIEFLPTDGVPGFVQEVRNFTDLTVGKITRAFVQFRKRKLTSLGLNDYKQFRTKYLSGGIERPDRILDGIVDLPGKTLIKMLVDILNKIGKSFPKWAQLHHQRVLDEMLADLDTPAAQKKRASFTSKRALSWACRS